MCVSDDVDLNSVASIPGMGIPEQLKAAMEQEHSSKSQPGERLHPPSRSQPHTHARTHAHTHAHGNISSQRISASREVRLCGPPPGLCEDQEEDHRGALWPSKRRQSADV